MSAWGALAQVASSALQVAGGLYESSKSQRAAAANLRSQLEWERERATNAHQWEVADLRAAGLNPILSATGGSGAHTSPITPQMPDFSGISKAGSALGTAVTRAYEIMTADKNLNQQDANIALTLQNAKKAAAETANTAASTLLISKQYEKAIEEINLIKEEIAKQGFANFIDFNNPHKYALHKYLTSGVLPFFTTGILGDRADTNEVYDPKTRTYVPASSAKQVSDGIRIYRLPNNRQPKRR